VIVVDASVLANAVADDTAIGARARACLAEATSGVSAPDLVDVETMSVLRRRWRAGDLTLARFEQALDDLLALPITRVPVGPLMRRAFELRDNITPYDAAYVALAEGLHATLVTGDARLARAPGARCLIEVLA
jgi:predicted nucleic acid-binding protein